METTVREAIKKNTNGLVIVDGKAYEITDIQFQESDMDTVLEVTTVQNPNTFEKDYGKVSNVAQGIVDEHRVIISF